jgi:hypothetical protein
MCDGRWSQLSNGWLRKVGILDFRILWVSRNSLHFNI